MGSVAVLATRRQWAGCTRPHRVCLGADRTSRTGLAGRESETCACKQIRHKCPHRDRVEQTRERTSQREASHGFLSTSLIDGESIKGRRGQNNGSEESALSPDQGIRGFLPNPSKGSIPGVLKNQGDQASPMTAWRYLRIGLLRPLGSWLHNDKAPRPPIGIVPITFDKNLAARGQGTTELGDLGAQLLYGCCPLRFTNEVPSRILTVNKALNATPWVRTPII